MRVPDGSRDSTESRGNTRSTRAATTHNHRPVARVRVVSSADGRHWIVREDGATSSLLFASNRVVRRVRDYPADWFDWPDDDLLAVSRRR